MVLIISLVANSPVCDPLDLLLTMRVYALTTHVTCRFIGEKKEVIASKPRYGGKGEKSQTRRSILIFAASMATREMLIRSYIETFRRLQIDTHPLKKDYLKHVG